MAAHKKVDWERIEPKWRAGTKSVLQIAAEYEEATGVKVSHTAINKHFKHLNVPRDLTAKIKSKADSIVARAMVSGKVSIETTEKEAKIIDVTALELANVQLMHRVDIKNKRALVTKLSAEIEAITDNVDLFDRLGELLIDTADDDKDKSNKRLTALNRALDVHSRIDSTKKLVETTKVLIALEREAYGIDGRSNTAKSLEDFLEELDGKS